MKWFEWISFLMQIITQIIPLIRQIEEAIGGGNGEIKKNIALSSIDAMARANNATTEQRQTLQGIADSLIDSHINSINETKTVVKPVNVSNS